MLTQPQSVEISRLALLNERHRLEGGRESSIIPFCKPSSIPTPALSGSGSTANIAVIAGPKQCLISAPFG
ncbi:Uncharacterised protein [Vibrio cholerae]|uniref:Uncharacterized protein n=1 Tax=Vibrio cholerae TaxID=666 RepID=A0A655ZSP1_VIBCL|nr:Uncharacterised protein [Vibrio cholerae]